MPHGEVSRHYAWANVFAFTSLRDTSGNVVLEALACGVPVICFDHQGVGDIVTEICGIKVPVSTPDMAVRDFAEAITRMARDRELWGRLSRGALGRAGDYRWEDQAEKLVAVYRRVAAAGAPNAAGGGTIRAARAMPSMETGEIRQPDACQPSPSA